MAGGNGMTKRGLHAFVRALAATMIAALCGCHHESAHAPPAAPAPPVKAADINAERLAAGEPDQWLTPGRDADGTFYSPLQDINAGNVGKLGFAWDYHLGTNRGQQSTPLVIDGVMYATSNFGRVYALDAASGKELWTYDPHIDGQWARYACCDAVNRGLAAFEGRLYVGRCGRSTR
jgi:quinohemoprotein ethanol dehydrogenase